MTRTRIILADDYPDVLNAVERLLEPAYDVVGTVGDGQSLFDAANSLKPDVLIVDISMPVLSGIEAATRLRESGNAAKIVFLSVHDDADYLRASLETGAFGYVVKPRMATDLVHAIQEALAGRVFVSPSLRNRN